MYEAVSYIERGQARNQFSEANRGGLWLALSMALHGAQLSGLCCRGIGATLAGNYHTLILMIWYLRTIYATLLICQYGERRIPHRIFPNLLKR